MEKPEINKIELNNNFNKKKVRKNQIDMLWNYAKAETEIHCKKFMQLFVLFLSIGISMIINAITEFLIPSFFPSWLFLLIGGYFILLSIWSISKIQELTKILKENLIKYQFELEKLK